MVQLTLREMCLIKEGPFRYRGCYPVCHNDMTPFGPLGRGENATAKRQKTDFDVLRNN